MVLANHTQYYLEFNYQKKKKQMELANHETTADLVKQQTAIT